MVHIREQSGTMVHVWIWGIDLGSNPGNSLDPELEYIQVIVVTDLDYSSDLSAVTYLDYDLGIFIITEIRCNSSVIHGY